MTMSPDFNFTKLTQALKAADEMRRPVNDTAARWVGELIKLTLWRANADIPAELHQFVENGSIDQDYLAGPVLTMLVNVPGGTAGLAELAQHGIYTHDLSTALAGYVRYHGNRGPMSGWMSEDSQNR